MDVPYTIQAQSTVFALVCIWATAIPWAVLILTVFLAAIHQSPATPNISMLVISSLLIYIGLSLATVLVLLVVPV